VLKPKKAEWVKPFQKQNDDGKPYWEWPGAKDSGVRHIFRLEGPVEQIVWELWLEDLLLASTTLFSRGRSEAEHYMAWWRFWALDAQGANRLLRANGYIASQHVDMRPCNCEDCVKGTAL
jgi:hypothetical protein